MDRSAWVSYGGDVEIFASVFTGVFTLLFIGLIGFWLLSRRIIEGPILGPLAVLSIDIALPCLTFTGIVSGFDPANQGLWWALPLWWAAFTAAALVLSVSLSVAARKEIRREFAAALFFQNGIFFPLAILSSMYGLASPILVSLFLFTLFYPAFFFTVSPLFFGKPLGKDPRKVFTPVLVATLLGVGATLLGLKPFIPDFLLSGLKTVGAMTIPLLMIVLGGNIFLDMRHSGTIHTLDVLMFVFVKNFLFPAVALAVLVLARPPREIALIIMLESAVPPITAIPIVAQREGGDRKVVNQFMVASFLVSPLSIPAFISLFSLFFAP